MDSKCSCGCVKPHVIAQRTTADGVRLAVWSDGALTTSGRLGTYLRGLGAPRHNYSKNSRRRAVFMMMDDFALYTSAEVPALVKAAQSTFAHSYTNEAARVAHAKRMAVRQ